MVVKRLQLHMGRHGLHEELQSAYRSHHSTETALLRVHNDILTSMDQREVVIHVLLDLNVAFDTVDHQILLPRLEQKTGLSATALQWFESYLSDRTQSVVINGAPSANHYLAQGVPQGSVLGPVLFTVYLLPVGDIIRQHGLSHHFFADDAQLPVSVKPPHDNLNMALAQNKIEACIKDITTWMTVNMLKLNEDKTEVVVIGTSHTLSRCCELTLHIGDADITPSLCARDLGVYMDCHLKMDEQVKHTCKAAYYHLHNIRRVRKYITSGVTEVLVHAFNCHITAGSLQCTAVWCVGSPAGQASARAVPILFLVLIIMITI